MEKKTVTLKSSIYSSFKVCSGIVVKINNMNISQCESQDYYCKYPLCDCNLNNKENDKNDDSDGD